MTKEFLIDLGEFDTPTMEEDQERMEMEHSLNARYSIDKFLDEKISKECQQRQLNRAIIKKAEKTFGKLRDAQDKGYTPNEIINYLTMLGLQCLGCGKNNISFPVLKYCDFSESVKCRDCQYK